MALTPSRSAFSSAWSAALSYSGRSQCLARLTRSFSSSTRCSSSSSSSETTTVEVQEDKRPERPRWSYTPERMLGPGFSINIVKDPSRKIWHNNDDPEKLDAMYNRLLGPNGDKMLPEEIKWLAITHKSFDQGRRGFNTRLAYFGRLIVALEATRSIMITPSPSQKAPERDQFGRMPFQHPALANVDKLNTRLPQDIVQKDKLAQLAVDVGLPAVVRWKPRMPEDLESSGLTVVLNTALYAIVGAISLQHGAEVAHRIVRDKILRRLGA